MYKNQYFITNIKIPNGYELKISSFNNLNIYSHSSLNLSKAQNQSTEVLLLGYIIDPLKPELGNSEIIRNLSETCNTKESFFKKVQLLSGRFVLLYKNDTDFIVLGDTCNLRQIYYCFSDNNTIITSSPKMFLDLYGNELVISELKQTFLNISEYKGHKYVWCGDESVDDRLKKVLPNHFLDITNLKVQRTPIYREELINVQDTLEYSAIMLKGSINAITKRYTVLQTVTAGTDTRSLLAASKEFQDDIKYYTFDRSTLKKSHYDTWIPQKLSARLGFGLQMIRPPERLKEEFLLVYRREHIFPRHLEQLKQLQYHYYNYADLNAVRICGFGSEIVRCRQGYTKHKINANIIKYLYGYAGKNEYVDLVIESWLNDTKDFSEEYNIPLLDLFHWEQQMGIWGALYAFEQDIAIEEFCPWYNKNLLLSVTRIDPQKRPMFRGEFHRNLIQYLWPEVLAEPINPVGFFGYLSGLASRNAMLKYYKIKAISHLQSILKK